MSIEVYGSVSFFTERSCLEIGAKLVRRRPKEWARGRKSKREARHRAFSALGCVTRDIKSNLCSLHGAPLDSPLGLGLALALALVGRIPILHCREPRRTDISLGTAIAKSSRPNRAAKETRAILFLPSVITRSLPKSKIKPQ